jgi:hypothetical protein
MRFWGLIEGWLRWRFASVFLVHKSHSRDSAAVRPFSKAWLMKLMMTYLHLSDHLMHSIFIS